MVRVGAGSSPAFQRLSRGTWFFILSAWLAEIVSRQVTVILPPHTHAPGAQMIRMASGSTDSRRCDRLNRGGPCLFWCFIVDLITGDQMQGLPLCTPARLVWPGRACRACRPGRPCPAGAGRGCPPLTPVVLLDPRDLWRASGRPAGRGGEVPPPPGSYDGPARVAGPAEPIWVAHAACLVQWEPLHLVSMEIAREKDTYFDNLSPNLIQGNE
eukprot:gene8809-biopygen122